MVELHSMCYLIFLDNCVEDGLLSYTEENGKGGVHRVHKLEFKDKELGTFLAKHVLTTLLKEFQDATSKVL